MRKKVAIKKFTSLVLALLLIVPFSVSVYATEHEYDWTNINIPYYQRAAYQYWMDTLQQSYVQHSISTQEAFNIGLDLDLGALFDGYEISIPATTITGNINDPSVQSNTYACYIPSSESYHGSYSGSSTAGSESGTITGSSQAHCVFRTGAIVATIDAPEDSTLSSGTIDGDITTSLYSYFRAYFEDGSILGNYSPPTSATLTNTLVGTVSTVYTFAFMSNKNITSSRDVLMYGNASKDDIVITGIRNRQEYGYYFTVIEYSMASGSSGNPRFVPVFASTQGLDIIPIYLGDKTKIPADMYRTIYNDQYLESLSDLKSIINSFKDQQHTDITAFQTQSHTDSVNLLNAINGTSNSTTQALDSSASSISSNSDSLNNTFVDIEDIESDIHTDFDSSLNAIDLDTNDNLLTNTNLVTSLNWIKSTYADFLTAMPLLQPIIVLVLSIGIGLTLIGRLKL